MMLEVQKSEISSCFDDAYGFARLDEEVSRSQAENALLRVKHHLEHLQRIWKGVLPLGLYWRLLGACSSLGGACSSCVCAGSLCDFAANRLVADISSLPGTPRGNGPLRVRVRGRLLDCSVVSV